jgi:hypothetical protein
MSFVVVKGTVITAHILVAFATGITEHNLVTAHSQPRVRADPVMLIIERH